MILFHLVLQKISGGECFVPVSFSDVLNFQKSRKTGKTPTVTFTTLEGKWSQYFCGMAIFPGGWQCSLSRD